MSAISDSTSTNDIELSVNRVMEAPRDLVFKAWTEPERLKQWWSPVLEADIRPARPRRAEVRNPDGSGAWSHGEYREIVAPERIVYTFAWDANDRAETTVTVTLADDDGKTSLTAHQGLFATPEDRDSHAQGWNVAFDELAAYLASASGGA